ncbi:hypothetical protein HPB49_007409 [Dermacentor silvarum]|uniref:Uncharacterized protein n=1 Tax=Dermacentor silvarum TaxID=543639 RepID=A0ACB8D3P9_DERSI|nr:hypothetical protein HPB49_007409 [Dermacentor silvarum]
MVELWSESPRPSDYVPESAEANVLARNGYMLGAEIGSGSYATIAIVAKENLAYACKIVNMGETSREYRTRFLPREINILARLRHPNIARVFQIICEARKVFFIMELATAGDLLFKIQGWSKVPRPPSLTEEWQFAASAALPSQARLGVPWLRAYA